MKLLKFPLVFAFTFLIGCSSTKAPQEQQLNTLSNKVDKLTMEVSRLKFQQEKYEAVIAELKRTNQETNQRVKNVSATYTK